MLAFGANVSYIAVLQSVFSRGRSILGRPQVSFLKRQREQQKRERQQLKAERRAQRKTDEKTGGPEIEETVVQEESIPSSDV